MNQLNVAAIEFVASVCKCVDFVGVAGYLRSSWLWLVKVAYDYNDTFDINKMSRRTCSWKPGTITRALSFFWKSLMSIKQEGEENAKSKATRKASSRGLSLVLHTIQDKEGKEDKYEPDMVDYPGSGRFSLCLPPFSFFLQSFRSGQVGWFVSSSYLRNSLSSFVIMLGERCFLGKLKSEMNINI
ncbi:hypothetical protein QVD17_30214 [Tagetes erecta]|uniref:Uncharacterized protein n=1 Tax=Tagetes erecta TaxID=13708 RepID=A0AAD8K148_TARER|nr:hypothetical protein QVD17_30214 [Tagetes erecta]